MIYADVTNYNILHSPFFFLNGMRYYKFASPACGGRQEVMAFWKGDQAPYGFPISIWARAEFPSRMTVFSLPSRLFFRASRARLNS